MLIRVTYTGFGLTGYDWLYSGCPVGCVATAVPEQVFNTLLSIRVVLSVPCIPGIVMFLDYWFIVTDDGRLIPSYIL